MPNIVSAHAPIFEVVAACPDVIDIMLELGFEDIAKPGMLQTAGRFMTLAKGAKLRKVEPEAIINKFAEHGYTVQF